MKYLDIPLGICAAVAAARWIALDMWNPVSMELVVFLTVLGMGSLAAMTMTITAKGAEEMNVGEARAIGGAWQGLVGRLIAVVCLSISGALAMVLSRALLGKTVVTIETPEMIIREDFDWALSGLIAFLAVMAVTRLIPVMRSVSNLAEVNRELAVKGVLRSQARVADQSDGRVATLKVPTDQGRKFNR